jgi:hypothetical protein
MTTEAPTLPSTLYNVNPGDQAFSGGQAPHTPSTGAPARPPVMLPMAPRQASTADDSRRPHKGGSGGGSSSRGDSTGRGATIVGRRSTTLDQHHLHVAGTGPRCLSSSSAGASSPDDATLRHNYVACLQHASVRRAPDDLGPASAPAYEDPHHDIMVPVRWRLEPSLSRRRLQHYGVSSTIL